MEKGKREAINATRTAFGADYEANLRKEAGPNPEKVARRKHQISSLYHQAKMKVSLITQHIHKQALRISICPTWHEQSSCHCTAQRIIEGGQA